jgi:mono/diheme cytochrome c family protein
MNSFFRVTLSICLLLLGAAFIDAAARVSPASGEAGLSSSAAFVDASATGLSDARGATVDGQQIYMTRCMACHHMEGEGMRGIFPPLAGTEWVTGDKERLIRIVLHGVSGEIEVAGEVYNGLMPGWRAMLTDDEIAAVLTYIRSEWSNDASAVTADEVAAVRESTGDREGPWTAAELEKVIR